MSAYDPNHDAYAILGVAPDASDDEIKAAYRKSALIWHPDKSPAPDAAERFHEIKKAATLLRNPMLRKLYDMERARWRKARGHSPRDPRPKRKRATQSRDRTEHAPMPPPPDWLAPAVRIHYDSVHIALQAPDRGSRMSAFLYGCAFMATFGALVAGDFRIFGLALVLFAAGRVARVPPHRGVLSWAKLIPGRRLAEFHLLNQRAASYERFTIPYEILRIIVVETPGSYQVMIEGFPRASRPVLFKGASKAEAKKHAREAGSYFELPFAA